MKAIQVSSFGAPEVLRLTELSDPAPGPGEVAIDVTCAAAGLIDVFAKPAAPGKPSSQGVKHRRASASTVGRRAVAHRMPDCSHSVGPTSAPAQYAAALEGLVSDGGPTGRPPRRARQRARHSG